MGKLSNQKQSATRDPDSKVYLLHKVYKGTGKNRTSRTLWLQIADAFSFERSKNDKTYVGYNFSLPTGMNIGGASVSLAIVENDKEYTSDPDTKKPVGNFSVQSTFDDRPQQIAAGFDSETKGDENGEGKVGYVNVPIPPTLTIRGGSKCSFFFTS